MKVRRRLDSQTTRKIETQVDSVHDSSTDVSGFGSDTFVWGTLSANRAGDAQAPAQKADEKGGNVMWSVGHARSRLPTAGGSATAK
jgi:hypothetical protein